MNDEDSLKLTPPWYTYFNLIKHSIGKDRYIEVFNMKELSDTDFLIQIKTRNKEKALALATLISPIKKFGNTRIYIEVTYCGEVVKPTKTPQNVNNAIKIVRKALGTNHYFESVEHVTLMGRITIFPVFKKEVIQFFNDDLSDLYNNFNGVAADVFSEILRPFINEFPIAPSTSIKKRSDILD